ATCMNCHATIHKESRKLLPVREAYAGIAPVEWVRVHDIPDYVYFNHSAHVTRGIGCESCHGRIDLMEEVYQHAPLTMGWCLDCHRDPSKNARPVEEMTTMGWNPPDRAERSARVAKANELNPPMDCSTCHR